MNAGAQFCKNFADEPLLERLRLISRDDFVDAVVRQKCQVLFREWASTYQNTSGLYEIANLYKQLPNKKASSGTQTRFFREAESDATETPKRKERADQASASVTSPSIWSSSPILKSSKKTKTTTIKFNLEKEKPQIMQTIAQSSVASTNLLNSLQLINREKQRISENKDAVQRFDTCKDLRRQILQYIQIVESDELIGSLLSANDDLIKALRAYDIMDRSIDDDSDSDSYDHKTTALNKSMEGLRVKMPTDNQSLDKGKRKEPPLPESDSDEVEEDDDEDNPFGDRNAVKEQDRPGMRWKTV